MEPSNTVNLTETKQALEAGEKLYRAFKGALDVVLNIEKLDNILAQYNNDIRIVQDTLTASRADLTLTEGVLANCKLEVSTHKEQYSDLCTAISNAGASLTTIQQKLKEATVEYNGTVSANELAKKDLSDARYLCQELKNEHTKISSAVNEARANLSKLLGTA